MACTALETIGLLVWRYALGFDRVGMRNFFLDLPGTFRKTIIPPLAQGEDGADRTIRESRPAGGRPSPLAQGEDGADRTIGESRPAGGRPCPLRLR
jgi:hypothetical protein